MSSETGLDHSALRDHGEPVERSLLRCHRSALDLTEHLESEARLEDQAGSRVEGKWGPLWSAEERRRIKGKASMFEHRGERPHACAACGARTRTPDGYAGGPDQRVAQRP